MANGVARTRARVKGTSIYAGDLRPAYDAASHGRTRRHWRAPEAGPATTISFNLPALRRRSRDQIRQNTYASRASDAAVANIVGTGIKPLPKVDDDALNRRIRDLWGTWVTEADAAQELDFYGLQAQIVRAWFEGGECFIRRRVRRPEDGLSVPLQLQVLESEHVPADKNSIARNGNVVRHGIEFDAIGRRVAYHMYRAHPGDHDGLRLIANNSPETADLTTRVPADEVLHIFLPTRPGQKRGEPWLTQALLALRDLDEWSSAELQRQKAGAMFLGHIKKVGEEGAVLGDQDAHATDEAESDSIDVQTLEPMTVTELEEGEDITWSDPPEVGANYEVFLRSQLRSIAQSVGVLYEQLTGDYAQINDRTYRAAHNEVRRQVEMLQQNIVIPQLCRPTWGWWFDLARTSGVLTVPQRIGDEVARRVGWVPHAFRHIHPLQDVQADKARVRSGFKSRHAVALENGEDVEDIDRQVSRDKQRAEQLELVFDTEPWNTSQSGGAQDADPDSHATPER